jgi:hypothetical protein
MKQKGTAMLAAGMCLGLGFILPAEAAAGKPNTMRACLACHRPEAQLIRGKSVNKPENSGIIQIDVGPLIWNVKFDTNTAIKCAESLASITEDKEIAVTYNGDEKNPVATLISIKKPVASPGEKLVSVEEMKALVALGPEEGDYLLIDSRPPAAYLEGHIPTAVSIPFTSLQKQKEAVLPPDKDQLIIFYCDGFT